MKLTDKAIEQINNNFAEKFPHSGMYLANECGQTVVRRAHDGYICRLEGLWYLASSLASMTETIKDTIGLYEEE